MDKDLQLVGIRVGRETFGLPISLVREIVRVPEITFVPNAPEYIEGVINLRGRIIPVVDLRKRFGEKHPLYIGGEKIWTDNLTPSVNPAEPTEIVGYGTEAGVDEAERAVKAARAAFEKWRWTPFEERAQLLELLSNAAW